mmetsp:Transcript_88151/g.234397  ORF Transcript_88151/g.234397 Transcript_88151/m.234397 type:complete len:407 (-) Transcript_88151:417-1637(-)
MDGGREAVEQAHARGEGPALLLPPAHLADLGDDGDLLDEVALGRVRAEGEGRAEVLLLGLPGQRVLAPCDKAAVLKARHRRHDEPQHGVDGQRRRHLHRRHRGHQRPVEEVEHSRDKPGRPEPAKVGLELAEIGVARRQPDRIAEHLEHWRRPATPLLRSGGSPATGGSWRTRPRQRRRRNGSRGARDGRATAAGSATYRRGRLHAALSLHDVELPPSSTRGGEKTRDESGGSESALQEAGEIRERSPVVRERRNNELVPSESLSSHFHSKKATEYPVVVFPLLGGETLERRCNNNKEFSGTHTPIRPQLKTIKHSNSNTINKISANVTMADENFNISEAEQSFLRFSFLVPCEVKCIIHCADLMTGSICILAHFAAIRLVQCIYFRRVKFKIQLAQQTIKALFWI